jgi:hypothetical protein
MNRRFPVRPSAQRGAGSLIVVMVLFFVISLVAAYASRNMIFEQKTSANQYRSTQAFEVAEAGIEWGLAMLNSGRIDDNCSPSATGETFRTRYLSFTPGAGTVTRKVWLSGAVQVPFSVLCVRTATGWSCNCPSTGAPSVTAPAGTAPAPAFRLTFLAGGTGNRPGAVLLRALSCTRLDDNCLADNQITQPGDAVASITTLIALKGAITAPPAAALTAGGAITLTGGNITNTEPLVNGMTVDALGAFSPGPTLTTVPGSPSSQSITAPDAALPAAADLMFASVFGISRATYQQQPSTIVLTCPAQCATADLATLAANNPGRMLWLLGDADLSSAVSIGSATSPVVMVVNGNLTASAAATVFGLVYVVPNTGTTTWTTSGSVAVQGAVVSEAAVAGTATPSITYDLGVLTSLRQKSGSFVRVPGGWKDY